MIHELKVVCLAALVFSLAACDKPEDKEAKYIRRGNAMFDAGEYAKARIEYKNAARIMPTDAEPSYRIGLVDEAEGDVQNAFAGFTAAEQQNHHFHPALLKLAQYYLAGGDYFQSQNRVDSVLADAPDDPEAHALRAAIMLRRENFAGAESEARTALAKDPANITAVSVLTGLYTEQRQDAKAEAVLDEGIAHNTGNIPLLLLKAAVNEKAGDLDKVRDAYDAIFALSPRAGNYRADLAAAYLKAGKTDAAEAVLRNGIEKLPADETLKKALIDFLGKYRGVEAARKEVELLTKASPSDEEPYFRLAGLYSDTGRQADATELLENVIAREGVEHAGLQARTHLARIRFDQGDRDQARKLLKEVLDKEPANRDALFILAEISSAEGWYQDAISDLRTMLRDNPHSKDALQLLAEIFLLQGHTDLAIDTESQLAGLDPESSTVKVRLAQMYSLNGNAERSLELLHAVTLAQPEFAIGWESTARVAIGAQSWQTAEAAIAALDALDKGHMTAVYLKGEMAAAKGNFTAAAPLYLDVINADPSSPLAEHALADMVAVFRRERRVPEAIAIIRTIRKDTPYIAVTLGQCLSETGQAEDAAKVLDAVIGRYPSYEDLYLARAKLYLRSGDGAKALDVLAKARKMNPADMHALMTEAEIFSISGRYKEAIADYAALMDNFQSDAAANNMASLTADYEFNDFNALEKARQAAERFAGSNVPAYLDTLGWLYYREGKLPEAEVIMGRMLALKENIPEEAHYHYAVILLKEGKTAEAKTELINATKSGAAYPGLAEAQNLLKKQ